MVAALVVHGFKCLLLGPKVLSIIWTESPCCLMTNKAIRARPLCLVLHLNPLLAKVPFLSLACGFVSGRAFGSSVVLRASSEYMLCLCVRSRCLRFILGKNEQKQKVSALHFCLECAVNEV